MKATCWFLCISFDIDVEFVSAFPFGSLGVLFFSSNLLWFVLRWFVGLLL